MLRIYMLSKRQNSKSSLSLHPSSPTSSHTDQNVSNTRHGDLSHPHYVTTSSYYPFPLPSPSLLSPPGIHPQLYRTHANLPTLPIYLSHSAFPPSLPFTRISKRLNHPSILNSPPSLTSINYEQAGATCIDQTQSSLLERLEPHSFSLSLYKYIILSYITLCFKHDVVDAV